MPSPWKSPLPTILQYGSPTYGRDALAARSAPLMNQTELSPLALLRQTRSDRPSPCWSPRGGPVSQTSSKYAVNEPPAAVLKILIVYRIVTADAGRLKRRA